MISFYNEQVFKWEYQTGQDANVDDFVISDDKKIKWSSALKQKLKGRQIAEFSEGKIRQSLYRPFTKSNLFFDRVMNHRVHSFPSIFPTLETEAENRVICVSGLGHGFLDVICQYSLSTNFPDSSNWRNPMLPLLHLRRGRNKSS